MWAVPLVDYSDYKISTGKSSSQSYRKYFGLSLGLVEVVLNFPDLDMPAMPNQLFDRELLCGFTT